jgi:CRISPR-associated protein Csx17
MTLQMHQLTGCSPTPLADYLKAVGVLRLVSEQADDTARGFWKDESFSLITTLPDDQLTNFVLHRYQPTPLIAPWNGGSGFYPKDKKDGITALTTSVADRFEPYRLAIAAGLDMTRGRDKSPKNDEKCELIAECSRRWRGPLLDWLNAALVLTEEGDPAYPALLGTGGNDGRLDFTNNFMQRLTELFDFVSHSNGPLPRTAELLGAALFAERQYGLRSVAIGQFNPGGAGGANSSIGFAGAPLVNPWDFVLMLEGAIAFASGVARTMSTEQMPQAAAPFAVYPSPSGYASGVEGEKSRGEQWMPIWDHPLTFRELEALLGEGRCQFGDRTAKRPLDMARAVARLGVARGIAAFQRYGYIERNGQANLATPLGRWQVPKSQSPFQQLLDEVEAWVDRFRQRASGKGAPATIGRSARRCENAMMNCCREGHMAARWQELLVSLGEAEATLIRSPGFTASAGFQPLAAYSRGLSPTWLIAAGADSAELRLALALAGAHGIRSRRNDQNDRNVIAWDAADPVRRHFLPLERREGQTQEQWRPRRFAMSGEQLTSNPAVVCTTGDLHRDTVALVRRRSLEAHRLLDEFLPLAPVPGSEASLCDLRDFVSGQLNAAEILSLARPLMAIDWSQFIRQATDIRQRLVYPSLGAEIEAADALGVLGLFKLCHHWAPIPLPMLDESAAHEWDSNGTDSDSTDLRRTKPVWTEHVVRLSRSIFARLAHGDLAIATHLAVRRLKASALRPHLTQAVGDRAFALRLAASLAFPIGQSAASRLAGRLLRPHFDPADRDLTSNSGVI